MASINALPAAVTPDMSAVRLWHAPSLDALDNLDLLGLITSGALQGLQVTPEGALLFHAVDGPPPGLEDRVQPVLEAPQDDRLQRLEDALQSIRDDLEERERLLDRLDAVEFALNERLGYGMTAAQEEEAPGEAAALAAWHEDGLSLKLARLEEMLAALPAALRAPAPEPALPGLTQEAVEAAIEAAIATIPDRLQALPISPPLAETLEEIASRPLPPLDLTPQRQMHAQFLQAAGVMLRRIEAALPEPQAPHGATAAPEIMAGLADLGASLATISERLAHLPDTAPAPVDLGAVIAAVEARVDAINLQPPPRVDMAPLHKANAQFLQAAGVILRRMEAALLEPQPPHGATAAPEIMAGLADLGASLATISERLAQLPDTVPAPVDMSAVIAAVEARVDAINLQPPPRVDMAPLRKANAQFLQATGQVLGRLEHVTEALTQAAPDTSLGPQLETLATELRHLNEKVIPADLSGVEQALEALGRRIERIEQRADPVLDLTEQRRSFAAFATALAKSLKRIEGAADRCEAVPAAVAGIFEQSPPPRPRDDLADAILALAARAAEPPALLPWQEELSRLQEQQQAFYADMRFLLAEMAANQLRQSAQD